MTHILTTIFLRVFIYALIVAGIAQFLFHAATVAPANQLSEHTLTEWAQVLVLSLCISFLFLFGWLHKQQRVLLFLLAGTCLWALIREFDWYLNERVFDNAWQVLGSLVLFTTLTWVYRQRSRLHLTGFANSSSFGIMLGGFLTVAVFSRLFGRKIYWQEVAGEHYVRAVKNAAEEGVELFGYTVILLGIVELLLSVSQRTPKPELSNTRQHRTSASSARS